MTRRAPALIAGLLALLVATGCASLYSYERMARQARLSIIEGNYADALAAFPESSARGRNEVLVRLERGLILQGMDEFAESSRELLRAAERIGQYEDRAVVSAGRTALQAGSLLINEQVQPYEGEDFEKILVHAFNALNYLMMGDLEGARVEIRNAYRRQEKLREKHAAAREKVSDQVGGGSWEGSFRKADSARYDDIRARAQNVQSVYQNAFAYYISSLVYELGGEVDEAYIDLKRAIEAAPGSESIRRDLVRLSRELGFREDEQTWLERWGEPGGPCGAGTDVFVIFQHGTAPVKEAVSFPLVLSGGGVAFLSLPVYRFVPSGTREGRVLWDGGSVDTSVVSDTDAIAARNLLDRFPVLFAKQAARSYLKAGMTNRLSREYDAIGAIAGTLLSAVTEQADLRTWSSLPKEICTTRAFVPEGTRRVTVQSLPGGRTGEVSVPEGARHLIVLCRDTGAGLTLEARAY